jgi:hypothetical protein
MSVDRPGCGHGRMVATAAGVVKDLAGGLQDRRSGRRGGAAGWRSGAAPGLSAYAAVRRVGGAKPRHDFQIRKFTCKRRATSGRNRSTPCRGVDRRIGGSADRRTQGSPCAGPRTGDFPRTVMGQVMGELAETSIYRTLHDPMRTADIGKYSRLTTAECQSCWSWPPNSGALKPLTVDYGIPICADRAQHCNSDFHNYVVSKNL